MARQVRSFAVTLSAGGSSSSPVTTALALPPGIVRKVRVRTPPGPLGQVGWALGSAGQRVIPWGGTSWIIANDEVIEWEPTEAISSGAWQLIGYNAGSYDHTLYVTFDWDPPGPSSGAADVTLLPLVGLTG